MSGPALECTAYLQIRRADTWRREARVLKSTQRKPEVVEPGCVVVKVCVRIPAAAFEPLQPEAVVTIPEDLVQRPVEVEAVEP